MKCPKCGGNHCHLTISNNVSGNVKGYGMGKGCCGFLLLGPVGLICGLCNSGGKIKTTTQEFWVCDDCGTKFTEKESRNSKAFEEKFYFEHSMEYPEYAENEMIKSFSEIYAKELLQSPLSTKIITRKCGNQALEEQKRICSECLEKELILFAIEDVTGLIVTVKQIVVNDVYLDLNAIKSVSQYQSDIYINQFCVRFSTNENANITYDLLERLLKSRDGISFVKFDVYEQLLEYLQNGFVLEKTSTKAHYSSQEMYSDYVSKLNKESWNALQLKDLKRYRKYTETIENRKKTNKLFYLSDAILAITVMIIVGINPSVGFLHRIFLMLLAGSIVFLMYELGFRLERKRFDIDLNKFSAEILPKELMELDMEDKNSPLKKQGNILVSKHDEYRNLPGLVNIGPVSEKDYLKPLRITAYVAIGLSVVISVCLIELSGILKKPNTVISKDVSEKTIQNESMQANNSEHTDSTFFSNSKIETKGSRKSVAEEESTNPVAAFSLDDFLGEWWDQNSQRCYMIIEKVHDSTAKIVVQWGNSAYDAVRWEMTGQINTNSGHLVYNDCVKEIVSYGNDGSEQSEVLYTNGKGWFSISDDGFLYWEDEIQQDGDGCYFKKESDLETDNEYLGNAKADSYYEEDWGANNNRYLYVVNCQESITLRYAPSTQAAEITQIPLYAAVEFLDIAENGFYFVSYNGMEGYALASYLDVYEPQVATGATCTVVNCNESITLRTSPSTRANEICQIPLGAIVYYIEAANDFYLITYNGQTGYALASYLQFN